jgi:hypothetical protein
VCIGFTRQIHFAFSVVTATESAILTICVGEREAWLLNGNHSLDPGEKGKSLFGCERVRSSAHRLLKDGDKAGL